MLLLGDTEIEDTALATNVWEDGNGTMQFLKDQALQGAGFLTDCNLFTIRSTGRIDDAHGHEGWRMQARFYHLRDDLLVRLRDNVPRYTEPTTDIAWTYIKND